MNVGKLKTTVVYSSDVTTSKRGPIPDGSYMKVYKDLKELKDKYSHYINSTKVTNVSRYSKIGVVLGSFDDGSYPEPNQYTIYPILYPFSLDRQASNSNGLVFDCLRKSNHDKSVLQPIIVNSSLDSTLFGIISRINELECVKMLFKDYAKEVIDYSSQDNSQLNSKVNELLRTEKLFVEDWTGNKYIYDKMDYIKCDLDDSKPMNFLILYCKPYELKVIKGDNE